MSNKINKSLTAESKTANSSSKAWSEFVSRKLTERPAQPCQVSCGDIRCSARCKQHDQPAQQNPLTWADDCRIELVTAINCITSDYENALGVFSKDFEARRKAEGDIAHARMVAAKWNWNGRTSPPQSAQEPVGEITAEDMGRPFNAIRIGTHFYKEVPPVGTKLYTTPPQRKPLTYEQIAKLWAFEWKGDRVQFIRIIEAAHNIKG